jgi:hypothetical protein
MKKVLKLLFIAIMVVNMIACEKKNDPAILFIKGTVVAESRFASLPFMLVQVENEYPIGRLLNFTENMQQCYNIDKSGLYQNIILVQSSKCFADRDDKYRLGDIISFSYREYNHELDKDLFTGIMLTEQHSAVYDSTQDVWDLDCTSVPMIPRYVITDYKFLK